VDITLLNSIPPDTLTEEWLNYYILQGLIYNHHFVSSLKFNYDGEKEMDNLKMSEGFKNNFKKLKLKGINPVNDYYLIIFMDFEGYRILLGN
jgi:hypothetical protein